MAPSEWNWKPFLPGRAPPPTWPSWESFYLSIGLKIAMDYLNLPAGVGRQANDNKRRGKKVAKTARHWCLRWYEITRNSGVTVPALMGPPVPPTYAVLPAAIRPKWKARWLTDVNPHNDAALPAHDMTYLHRNIWSLNDSTYETLAPGAGPMSAPARRAAHYNGPLALRGLTRANFHANLRRPQGQAGTAGTWVNLSAVERARIIADCANYQPMGGFPLDPAARAVALTTSIAGLGCFFDRLPEFLCQLGDVTKASAFS